MGKKRRIGITALIAVCTVLLLIPLALLLLASGPGERFLKDRAEEKLSEVTGRDVTIGFLETDILSRLVLRDVIVPPVIPADSTTNLRIDDLQVAYDLSRLLNRVIVIKEIRLSALDVTVVRLADGTVDIPLPGYEDVPAGESTESPWKIDLINARVDSSSIRYLDLTRNGWMSASIGFDAGLVKGPGGGHLFALAGTQGQYSDSLHSLNNIVTSLAGEFSDGSLAVDSVSVAFPGLALSGSGSFEIEGVGRKISGQIGIDCGLGELLSSIGEVLPEPIRSTNGQIGLQANIDGTIEDPLIDWSIKAPRLETDDILIIDTYCGGSLSKSSIEVDTIDTRAFGGRLTGRAVMAFDSIGTVSVDLAGKGFSLKGLLEAIHRRHIDYSGLARLEISLRGPLARPEDLETTISADIYDIVYAGRPAGRVNFDITMKDGRLDLNASQDSNSVVAKGTLRQGMLDIEYAARVRDAEPLAALAAVTGLTGELDASGSLGGELSAPAIEISLTGRKIQYRGIPLDSVSCQGSFAEGAFKLRKAVFRGTRKGPRSEAVSDLIPGLTGLFAFEGELGSWPEDPAGRIEVMLDRIAYETYRVEEGKLSAILRSGMIRIEELDLKSDSVLVRGDGSYDLEAGKGELDAVLLLQEGISRKETGTIHLGMDRVGGTAMKMALDLEKFDLSSLSALISFEDSLSGTADVSVLASGRPDSIIVSAEVFVAGPAFRQAEVDSLFVRSRYFDGAAHLDSLSVWKGEDKAVAKALLVMEEDERGLPAISSGSLFSGMLKTDGIDISAAAEFMPSDMQPAGILKADLGWNGTLRDPAPEGIVQLSGGSLLSGSEKASLRSIELHAVLQDSIVVIRDLSGLAADLPFRMRGELRGEDYPWVDVKIDLSADQNGSLSCIGGFSADSLDLAVNIADFDISLLAPFIDQLTELSGRVDADLDMAGRPVNPRLMGRLTGKGLGMIDRDIGLPVSNGIIDIVFERNRINIDSLAAEVAGGRLTVSGEVGLGIGGPDHFDLKCTARGMEHARKKIYSIRLESADISLITRGGYNLLDGEVLLGETRLTSRFKPQSILPFTRSLEKPPGEVPEFLSKTRLDLRIRENGNLWVDNNLARLRLGASLNLIGYASNPNASGRVTIKKGYLIFLDRKLEVSRGTIDFIDPERLNPLVDIEAATVVKTYRGLENIPYDIRLSVQGKLDEAKVSLTSTPPLDRADIVSLLTIGMTRSQLSGTNDREDQASVRGVLLERAKQLSAQRMANYVSGKVGSALGLDQLTVEGDLFDPDGEQGAMLSATKRISDRAEITYTTGIGHINDQRVRLEYRLTERISVQGETDQAGRSGLDLKYRLRFR